MVSWYGKEWISVDMGKTKVKMCKNRLGQEENTETFPCGIYKEGIEVNSIRCTACISWTHKM